ncbi:MAG: ABC transporter ATP-binding protein [Verrucomicrobia bacterium]|nr:ABC transporter ATP-binding protein [Verrucomicrobiota bacterium]
MKEPILTIDGLDFAFDGSPVLENVHFTVEKGEFIGIFGPNGGGKTTLLKLILGLIPPQKGKILLFGKPPHEVRGKVGYVPQALRFDKAFPISALEVVRMGILSHLTWWGGFPSGSKEKARHALEQVGMAHKADEAFGSLSGGEAQRVLIARATVENPELLILDEPTASVDQAAEQSIFSLLDQLKQKMTILMVTHDLQTIIDRAGRLLCVHRQVTSMRNKEVCEHFALGLYHTPLTSKDHFFKK